MKILKYILIIISLTISSNLFSQEQKQAETTQQKVAAPKIKLIPSFDLTNRLPDATNKVKKIGNSLISQEKLYEEKKKLDNFLAGLKRFEKEHNSFNKNMIDQGRLQDELYQWNKKKDELAVIQKSFSDINNDLLEKKEALQEISTLWGKSLEAAKKDNLPRNAKKMVQAFLNDINTVQAKVTQKSNFLYSQLEKLTAATISINDNIEAIEKKLNNLTNLLLFTKEPSLIKVIFNNEDSIENRRTYTLKEISLPIRNYVVDNTLYLAFHFLFFILLIFILTVVKKQIKPEKYRNINPRLLNTVFEVLSRPVVTSFLLYLLSSNILYSDAPPILRTLTYFLLLIPVMIILPVITVKRLNIYIYGLGFIYLLTLFLRLHLLSPVIQYLIILAATALSLIGISKFVKKTILLRLFPDSESRNSIAFLFYIFAMLLIISFVSILIGYYSLGVFLFDNTIWSIYRFFLYYAAYLLLEGFSELIIHSEYFQKINSVKRNKERILSWTNSVLKILITFYLLKEIFVLFRIWDNIKEYISEIWNYEIAAGELKFTIGSILTLVITIWVSNLLSKVISTVLEQDILKKFKLKRGVPRTISTIVKYGILTVGFLIAIAAAGMELQNFTIIIGALGVGIGFGLQDIINNFISGMILLFERPIQVGDTVQVDQLWGTVKNIGIRSSVIRAFDGSEVIVPNSMLISREVTNWTLSDQKRRLEIEVGVEYGTDLKKVIKILIHSARKHKDVMDDPAPAAWFSGFGDSSINFRLVFWHGQFDGSLTVKSEVAITIFDELSKAGITIPFPQQDVYIKDTPNETLKKEVKETKTRTATKEKAGPKSKPGPKPASKTRKPKTGTGEEKE